MGKKKKISKAEQKKINKKRFQRLAETIKGKDKKFGKKVGKKKKWADAPKEEPVRKLYYGEEYATGTFVGNLKGFGFVTMEDREEDILYSGIADTWCDGSGSGADYYFPG